MARIIRRKSISELNAKISSTRKNLESVSDIAEDKNLADNSTDDTYNRRSAALEAARAAKRAKRESGEVDARRNPEEVWQDDPMSLRKSISAKCYQCNGDENYRNRARYCIIFTCALWPVRPYGKGITQDQCRAYKED